MFAYISHLLRGNDFEKILYLIIEEETRIFRGTGSARNVALGSPDQTVTISDGSNKTKFLFFDPAGVYESQEIERAMTSDYGSSGTPTEVTMLVGTRRRSRIREHGV